MSAAAAAKPHPKARGARSERWERIPSERSATSRWSPDPVRAAYPINAWAAASHPDGSAPSAGSFGRRTSAGASSAVSKKPPSVSPKRRTATSSNVPARSSHAASPVTWCRTTSPSATPA